MRKTLTVAVLTFAVVASQSLLAESQSSQMHVSVEVLARTVLTIDSQPSTVQITADDVARGYVEMPSAVAFHVRSNARNGYEVQFQPVAAPFTSAQVSWGTTTATVSSDSSWVAQAYQQGTTFGSMTVRLALAPGAAPGTYAWPLAVGADSL